MDNLIDISNRLREQKRYMYTELLDGAGMSLSNNISEGSDFYSNAEFTNFLNYTLGSIYECTNVLVILIRKNFITDPEKDELFVKLELLSKKVTSFRKNLK